MKNTLLPLCLFCLSSAAFADAGGAVELEQAKKATAEFAATLKSELVAAMQSGGPVAAIEVCNTRAMAISTELSVDKGMNLSRVSLKNRNPDNAPNDWQRNVLESFEIRKQAGEAPSALSWHEIASDGDTREFRFMKAIPAGPVCLQCHGEAIAPAVAEKLAELYPQDKATGYREGDLRGAFVVTKTMD